MRPTDTDLPAGFDRQTGFSMSFKPAGARVQVLFRGITIADAARAMIMDEDGHRPVYYFLRDEVRMDLLERTTHSTH